MSPTMKGRSAQSPAPMVRNRPTRRSRITTPSAGFRSVQASPARVAESAPTSRRTPSSPPTCSAMA